MKLSAQFWRSLSALALVNFLASATSLADSPWSGRFSWTNRGSESDYGNVAQSVDLSIRDNGANADIGITISWRPGATVEIGATLPQSAITTESNGTVQVLAFSFTDGFQNKGTGRITVNGNSATISLDATETLEGRATRQYGDYTLTRRQ